MEDKHTMVIRDKYPKSRHHFLVLPKQLIPNLAALTPDQADVLVVGASRRDRDC